MCRQWSPTFGNEEKATTRVDLTHISTKLHQFSTSSFSHFARTQMETDIHTRRRR